MKSAWVVRNVESGRLSLLSSKAKAIQHVKVNYNIELKQNDYCGTKDRSYVNAYIGVRKNKVIFICDNMMIQ